MAEINIQKKKRPVWPWILVILLLAAVFIYIVYNLGGNRESDLDSPAGVDTIDQNIYDNDFSQDVNASERVTRYILFVRDSSNIIDEGRVYEFTSRGIRLLTEALTAVVSKDTTMDSRLVQDRDSLMVYANQIQKEHDSTKYAAIVKKSFLTSSDLMASIEKKKNIKISGNISEARKSAQSIKINQRLNDQKEEIKNFFGSAGEALQAFMPHMNKQQGSN